MRRFSAVAFPALEFIGPFPAVAKDLNGQEESQRVVVHCQPQTPDHPTVLSRLGFLDRALIDRR